MKSFTDPTRATPESGVDALDDTPPRVELNATASRESRAGQPLSLDARGGRPARRILVVDDDAAIRHLLAEVLNRAGYSAQSSENGETGWAALCAGHFDLLITDHEMPKLSGLDLLRKMRRDGSKMPAILISGALPWSASDLATLLAPGAAIEKPFALPAILQRVRSLISESEEAATEEPEFSAANFSPGGLPLWNAVIANTRL